MTSKLILKNVLAEANDTLNAFRQDTDQMLAFERFVDVATSTLQSGGRLLSCGNGGSLCDAMHFAQEWTGRLVRDRPALSAMAFSDSAQLSAIANDFGFDQVFARQVEARGRPGDLLVSISTSGKSPNVIKAVEAAKRLGIQTVGLLGCGGGEVLNRVDVAMVVPHAERADRIQEMHIKILHAAIQAVETRLFPDLEL